MSVEAQAASDVRPEELAEFKRRQHDVWAAGDYDVVAERILVVGERIVGHLGVKPGERVLDVACGTGNAAIPAARAGGSVVGVDLTPELFVAARAHAAEAGVEVDWAEGDAESLSFPDESFDVVVSTFGCMFAPRHAVTAAEMARVLRPGGRLGICSWTPESAVGDLFRATAAYMPPLPPFHQPPLLWGTEEHVRTLFGDAFDLEFRSEHVDFRYESVDEAVDIFATKFGPVVKARELLEPQGRWPELLGDYAALYECLDTSPEPDLRFPAEYLVALGRKRA